MGGELAGQVKGYLDASLDLYTADRTGRPDFAMSSTGGLVVETRDTRTFDIGSGAVRLFGLNLFSMPKPPQYAFSFSSEKTINGYDTLENIHF